MLEKSTVLRWLPPQLEQPASVAAGSGRAPKPPELEAAAIAHCSRENAEEDSVLSYIRKHK